MVNPNNTKYIVFDDGGFINSNPDNSGFPIGFNVYERILELAKKNEIIIPLACTANFFDIDRLYNKSKINPDAVKIMNLIRDNSDYLELWNHGLTHMFKNDYIEFYSYLDGEIDRTVQFEKFKLSQKIFNRLGFFPVTFVPPGHAWEPGVTDLISKAFGIKSIAIREFEKTPANIWFQNPFKRYKKEWESSNHLNTYFRLGLGLSHDQTLFDKKTYFKTLLHIRNRFPLNILTNRKIRLKNKVDHYFAHVQNLVNESSIEYFTFVIKILKQQLN
jgi:hypothetical protein